MRMNVLYSCKHLQYEFLCAYTYILAVLPCRTQDVTLELKDPQYPEHNLGSLELAVILSPKEGDTRDAVRKLYELSVRLLIHVSLFLHTLRFLLIQGESFFSIHVTPREGIICLIYCGQT